jgi:hypothetical protein
MKKFLLLSAIFGLLLTGPLVQVSHGVEAVDDPQPYASWAQEFLEHNVGFFDRILITMEPEAASAFVDPAFIAFNLAGWTQTSFQDQEARAAGPLTNELQLKIHFAGDSTTPLAFDFRAYGLGDETMESAHLKWSGGTVGGEWTITYNYDDPHCIAAVVPIPGAVLLLGAGLVRLAARIRREKELTN